MELSGSLTLRGGPTCTTTHCTRFLDLEGALLLSHLGPESPYQDEFPARQSLNETTCCRAVRSRFAPLLKFLRG